MSAAPNADNEGNGQHSAGKRNLGSNSRFNRAVKVDEEGIFGWLVYIIITLVTAIMTLWNTHIMGRITKCEEDDEDQKEAIAANAAAIHRIEVAIEKRFATHEKDELERDNAHAAAVAKEFKDLRRDVNTGHTAILKEVGQLARDVKQSNGRS